MKVLEVYQSVHGELPHLGKPCTIIRFAGCNLQCPYCDAPRDEGTDFSLEAIVGAAKMAGNEHILITGGEPMLQPDIDKLIRQLRLYYFVTVETNGTQMLSIYADCNVMDVKLFKEDLGIEKANLKSLRVGDAVKFVYSNDAELSKAIQFVESYCHHAPYMAIFSPVNPKENFMSRIVELQKRLKEVDIRLQVQIHKILEVG